VSTVAVVPLGGRPVPLFAVCFSSFSQFDSRCVVRRLPWTSVDCAVCDASLGLLMNAVRSVSTCCSQPQLYSSYGHEPAACGCGNSPHGCSQCGPRGSVRIGRIRFHAGCRTMATKPGSSFWFRVKIILAAKIILF